MVQRMTGLADLPEPDAADALAIALAFLGETGRFSTRQPKPL
jgi:Holliday junction resolvasome RuvABC endonuclease subunit